MFWEEEKALIVADLHFGKTGHFRKSGIAIPQTVYKEDLQRLIHQIQHFQPEKIIIAGDLFHSTENKELEMFQKWRKDFSLLKIHLIKGNHDILSDDWYQNAGIEVHQQGWIVQDFCFCHDLIDSSLMTHHSSLYSFSGHIHPAIHLNGMSKQSLRFPCFYFAKKYAVLPAFSRFTGTHLIKPEKGEIVFAIAAEKIIQVT